MTSWVEEILIKEDIRLEYWRKTGKIISPATLYKYAQKIREEKSAQEQSVEIQGEEERKRGITMKGVLGFARKLREKI